MKNRLSSVEKIRQQLLPVFKKYNVKQAILFGSYAKGEERENSDVDILVDSNLRGLAFYGLLEEVVNALGKSVDLLDKSQIVNASKIYKEISDSGVVIYG